MISNPVRAFSMTELRLTAKISGKLLHDTVRELVRIGFLVSSERQRKKFYQVNRHFALFPELVSMLRRVKPVPSDILAKSAMKVGECKFIALTGIFVGKPRLDTDLLFVGKVSPARLSKFLKLAEKLAEQEVSYTVFTVPEFEYRKIMNDRFVKDILENHPVIIVDKLKHHKLA